MSGPTTETPARQPFAVPADLAARGVTLRPQTEGDLPFVCRLYVSMRWDELAQLADWSDQRKVAFLEDQFAKQHQHYTLNYAGTDFLIIEQDGVPMGRLYLFREGAADLRIVDIGFLPEWRGQGLGTAFLTAVQAEARAGGKVASIHVENFNPARRLYQRLGFSDVSMNGCYWLMQWDPNAAVEAA